MSLLDGSFRGFPFNLTKYTVNGKNFTKIHDFLNSEENLVENFGRQSKTFGLTVVVGTKENYHRIRDQFMAVLDMPKEGLLVHPYLGEKWVVMDSYTHSGGDGEGIAEFDISFIEQKEPTVGEVDLDFEFGEVIDNFNSVSKTSMGESLSLSGLFNQLYRKIENGIISTLQAISYIKNSLDYTEYTEKVHSLIDIAFNEEYWDNIIEFFTFKKYGEPGKALLMRFLNYDREYPLSTDSSQIKQFKKQKNLSNETLKYVAISKLAAISIEEGLSNSEIDYVIEKIRESKHDPIIPGTYEGLQDIEAHLFLRKKYTGKTVNLLSPTPAVVIQYQEAGDFETIVGENYNINELMGEINVHS